MSHHQEDNPYAAAVVNDRGERPTWVRYQVLAWLCVAAAIAYICRQSIGVAESTIRDDLSLSKTQMGLVMSLFFWTYAFSQIPSGAVAHRFGSRLSLLGAASVWSLATGLTAFAFGFPLLLASRVLMGLGQAALFPAAVNTVSRWFPLSGRAGASGALGAAMGVGGALGVGLTGLLLGMVGWRTLFLLYALPGLLWGIGFYLWFREWPWEHSWVNASEDRLIRGDTASPEPLEIEKPELERETGALPTGALPKDAESVPGKHDGKQSEAREPTPWLAMYSSPALWWICGQQFCRAAGEVFFVSWFATYLQETHGVSIMTSGGLTMLPIVARVLGCFIGGFLSDAILNSTGSLRLARQGVAVVSLGACAAMVFLSMMMTDLYVCVGLVTLGSLFASFAGPAAYTVTMDMGGGHTPTLFSTMNMSGNLGAALFPLVTPFLQTWTGGWTAVFFMFGGLYVAASLFWLLLQPSQSIFEQSLIPRPVR
ncbi:MFS transporter [Lignipirellula cremea]|uniref:Putative sulfoacetate transporter SauU n=1 Tax=Lignipirellula cremea TaxID=2528010 RepID=A0A518E2K5_9BACT|nr:MFS transporter [Lignipirellula cremea]QDU98329.1 putative sulfoacetate transporter SauU [Lignipirellula cremea]